MKRVVFLDYLRVLACMMVMVVHACELYYFGEDGGVFVASRGDARWLTAFDSAVRASVPLFVMASAYLLFPLTRPTGEFFRRRLMRVGVPFAVWAAVYTWYYGGSWGQLGFNFPMATGGHLWFVPMLFGLYLLMPLISPWAEKVSERELRGWLGLWLVTTLFPYLRSLWSWLYGEPAFGAVPYLWGECPWNHFGAFQYVGGFIGYLLLGFWFRKFAPVLSWRRTLAWAVPLWVVGMLVCALPFYSRIPAVNGYPASAPYATAVFMEMSWEFCSTGVLMTVIAYFLIIRKFTFDGAFYVRLIRPLSEASYETYLMHMLILVVVGGWLKPRLATPLAILAIALVTFFAASVVSLALRRIPRLGRYL